VVTRHRSGWLLAIGLFLILSGPLAESGRADFTLTGSQQMTVPMTLGGTANLYDNSRVTVLSGGELDGINAYNNSIVNVDAGGQVGYSTGTITSNDDSTVNFSGLAWILDARGARVNFSGGQVTGLAASNGIVNINMGSIWDLNASGDSTVNLFYAGIGNSIEASGNSTVNIYGGGLFGVNLLACDSGTVIFHNSDFQLGQGLSLNGNQVLGTGVLSGHFANDTARWSVNIYPTGLTGGNILLTEVPEPATLSLLALAGSALLMRRRK
jgi:hypothetical protein